LGIIDKRGIDRPSASPQGQAWGRLAAIYHALLSEQTLDSLLDKIVEAIVDIVPYDTLTIYQADEAQRVLRPVIAHDPFAAEIMASPPTAFGKGITGWACEHREPVLSNQAHLDPRVSFVPGTPMEPEALISVPLIARGSVKGVLNIYRNGEENPFTDEEFALAQRFADAAALALDNANIREALEHQAQTDPLTGLYNHRFFHERLRSELMRVSRTHDSVAVMLFDIDDFKRANDVHGHAAGDQVLVTLADIVRSTVRASDVACRVGGEEFGVILPSCDTSDAIGLARRLRDRLAVTEIGEVGTITLSIGVAQGPEHAMNPRELVACAEAAMMTAKARGKDRAVLYDDTSNERPDGGSPRRDVRSISHLKMLQSLAGKLNRLNDVRQIATTIANELRTLIDYHNCRVYLAEGTDLVPVAFRGDLSLDGSEPAEIITTRFGEGITGRAASTGRSLLISNALECDFAVHLPGTEEIEESMVVVPMLYGARVNGVVAISKLGVDQFDSDDVRLLEVLAGQASVALENARLYEAQRREAENARALLDLADKLAQAPTFHAIGNESVLETTKLMKTGQASLWLFDPRSQEYRCAAHEGYVEDPVSRSLIAYTLTRDDGARLIDGRKQPFVIGPVDIERKFQSHQSVPTDQLKTSAIAPLPSNSGVEGWLVARQPNEGPLHFTEERLRLLAGIAYQSATALQKASLYKDQKEAADEASSLLDFSRQLSEADTLDEIFERTVELTARILGSPRSSVWLQEPGTNDLVCEGLWGYTEAERAEIASGEASLVPLRSLMNTTEPFVLMPDDRDDPEHAQQGGPLTYAVAPLRLEGRLGCVVVAAPAFGNYEFSERKMRLLAGIADQTKLAINNVSSFETLETTFLSTVEALANALEAKDEYTSDHARSIVEMSQEVGERLGMSVKELKKLEMGALFHDIGKIGIPSDILLKPGPLTDEEAAIMRTHPELGERILAPIERLEEVRPIVRACHEHFDGSGYPDSKVGEEIPIEARIILVCDAFHAMTTDRPYRDRLPVEEARRRLQSSAGKQFDPRIVEIFLSLLDEDAF
jgi:diguanylate cyclase (GGDEF)-like protein